TVQSAADEKPGSSDSMRVFTFRLNAILQQAEELIASKAIASHRLTELRDINGSIASLGKEWRKVALQLRAVQHADERNVRFNGRHVDTDKKHNGNTPLLALLERNERALAAIGNQTAALGAALDNDRRVLERRVGDLLDGIK